MTEAEELHRDMKAISATTAILSYLIDKYPSFLPNEDICPVFDEVLRLIHHYEYFPEKKSFWQRIFGE